MFELFDNISIKHKNLDGNLTINFSSIGKRGNITLPGQWDIILGKTFNSYNYIGEPLETIVINKVTKK